VGIGKIERGYGQEDMGEIERGYRKRIWAR